MSAEATGARQKFVRMAARALLYLLLLVSVIAASVGGIGTKISIERDLFRNRANYLERTSEEVAAFVGSRLLEVYLASGMQGVERYCDGTGIFYAIYTTAGRRVGGNIPLTFEEEAYTIFYETSEDQGNFVSGEIANYKVKVYLKDMDYFWSPYDNYLQTMRYISRYCYAFPIMFVAGSVVAVFCFLLLVRGSAEQPLLRQIPLEIVTAVAVTLLWLCSGPMFGDKRIDLFDRIGLEGWEGLVLATTVIAAMYFLHLVSRVRKPYWYRATLCYGIFLLIRRAVELWRELFRNLSLIWQAATVMLGVSVLEFAVIWFVLPNGRDKGVLICFWLAEKLFALPLLLYGFLCLERIQKAAGKLAAGNLSYQLDTSSLPGVLRDFGQNINAASDSVSLAVEERLKSERLKTELITNVSHDIKTPLTSIINFADLIGKEQTDNPKIVEYAGLLHKQSTRLKKLIEDLIEASKASTGNLEINPEACEVRTLLAQCLGEYEKRLKELDINLVVKLGSEPAWIMADTRLLWRIFENLMSNICKYAQRETRVYLSMERREDSVFITFKNISKYPLDVSAEELTERFVRGDLSRHTEGNGLGLSIVRSLMDLLGGRIELAVDGDLFKAILEFPVIEQPADEQGAQQE